MYFSLYSSDNEVSSSSNIALTVGTSQSCCFPAGSLVAMADGTSKPIEDVKVGDEILTFDESKMAQATGRVGALKRPLRDALCHILFSDGTLATPTPDHPLFTTDGWKSVDPEAGTVSYGHEVGKLAEGDMVLSQSGLYKMVTSITTVHGEFQTYTLKEVSPIPNFYCQGVLAHNSTPTPTPLPYPPPVTPAC
jgi:hypothetical protein